MAIVGFSKEDSEESEEENNEVDKSGITGVDASRLSASQLDMS